MPLKLYEGIVPQLFVGADVVVGASVVGADVVGAGVGESKTNAAPKGFALVSKE